MKKIELNNNWKFSIAGNSKDIAKIPNNNIKPGKWYDAEVPGTIHTDLLRNNLIDDPYYSDNELELEWIAVNDWIYKTDFKFNPEKKENYNLVFEGIDTVAEVFLNGSKIHSIENMFLVHKISVGKYLVEGINELRIYFHSPVKYAIEKEKLYGKLPVEISSYRAYIRKAQYSFGWDWGPSFPTSGIWKNVYLESEPAAEIENVRFDTLKITKSKAKVRVTVKVICKNRNAKKVVIKLGKLVKRFSISGTDIFQYDISITNPQLWWPNGEGEQNLYELSITLIDKKGIELDTAKKKVGIRTIELITKEKKENTFKLRINGRDIFAMGVNWIPADSFLPLVDNAKYFKLLSFARAANMNIVRVWGGGIYERDYFYELCDKLGLLVWQDFMFACGAYPEHKEYLNNVKEEIEQNVSRLQNHSSIALWCGNNENEWIWSQKQKTSYREMPAYKIYHEIIPSILKNLDPLRPYHPSSPFGWDEDPNSFYSGNTHQWEIWSKWIDYEKVVNDRSLFVTEFGFQGPANKDTFEKVIPSENRSVNDKVFEFHNKQVEGPERIWKFLSAHLPLTKDWDDYFYLTQLNQAFALKACLEHWRTNGRTNGSIIWQINDSWPVTSWAIIDYDLKTKMAYHFVKEIFSPQIIFFAKTYDSIITKVQNQREEKFMGKYKLYLIDASTGEIVKRLSKRLTLKGKVTLEVGSIPSRQFLLNNNLVLLAYLENSSGVRISTNYYTLVPWKHIKMAEARVSLQFNNNDSAQNVSVTADKPAFFIDLYTKGVEFDNRGFSILPGEKVIVNLLNENVGHIAGSDVKIYSLNKYLGH